MSNKLFVAPSPHQHSGESSSRIMMDVSLALLPAFALSIVVFGLPALYVTLTSIVSCVLFEFLIQKYLVKGEPTVGNFSALLTGLLLGFNLPSSIPLWIVVIGAFVSIAIAKMTFGGIGKNPFNPALVGRVFLLIAYPVQMTSFPEVSSAVDIFSGATPLAAMKSGSLSVGSINYTDMLMGSIPGSLGEVSALLLLLGGVYLLWRKVISWHIPVAMLLTMALVALIVGAASGLKGAEIVEFPLFHLLAGGAILGAVYMATDYVTSPMTHKGMIIYGVGIGLITMSIRLWGAYPEGVSFAILVMNACVPLINKYVKPKRFGVKR
ncbi:MAG: RnfABCDGE type electron transport complex subunit D [Rikenellaceae bacterium]